MTECIEYIGLRVWEAQARLFSHGGPWGQSHSHAHGVAAADGRRSSNNVRGCACAPPGATKLGRRRRLRVWATLGHFGGSCTLSPRANDAHTHARGLVDVRGGLA